MLQPNFHIIEVNGSDTMTTMAQKINENFRSLANFLVQTYENAKTDKVIAEKGQTIVSVSGMFARNSHTLIVFLNGVIQIQNESYVEISNKSIRFLSELEEGDEVYMVYNRPAVSIEGIIVDDSFCTVGEVKQLISEVFVPDDEE